MYNKPSFKLLASTLVISLIAFSCSLTAQDVVKQNRSVKEFSAIEVGGAFNVVLTQGNDHMVTVEADEDMINHVMTKVSGSTLVISLDDYKSYNKKKATVKVTFKELDAMEISGASNITSNGTINTGELVMEISGASNINLDLKSSKVIAEVSGASNIVLNGTAGEQVLEISGASNYKAEGLVTDEVMVEASGASHIKVHVTKHLVAEASGATSLEYAGNPAEIDIESSGASKVKKL